ncbi:MAG: cytochrome c biogenesis protein ResB [Thermomicrobiales bacterium]
MAQATIQQRTARRSPVEFVVDRIWRFFCSVRAAAYEIAILAVMVLIGTLRGSDAPQWLADALPVSQPIVDEWYAFDIFHSLPFMLILGMLAVAITVCTINRAPAIWRAITAPKVATTRGFLRNADVSASFQTPLPKAMLLDQLTSTLGRQRYRVLIEARGNDVHLYADKNRYAKLGTFPFHLALILILVGGIVGARYGFRETEFIIPEGSVREVGHGSDLSVGLERFTDSYDETGVPTEYRSDLVIYEDDKPVKTGSARVNHPLTYDSFTFYQTSFGQAVTLRVSDGDGRVVYDDSIALGIYRSRTNPDAPAGILDLPELEMRLHVIAPDVNRANQPELDDLQLASGQMLIQARPLNADGSAEMSSQVVWQGESATFGDVSVQFVRERQFTLLQVASNPGIPIFIAAALLLVGGLSITFYFPHRRIRGIVSGSAGDASAQLAPLVKRDWSGRRDFDRLVEHLERQLDVKALVRTNDEEKPVGAPAVADRPGATT